jgi:hypothetical protein
MSDTLNQVEDEMTDIPYVPENWQFDGRMYPPQPDNVFDVEGHPNVRRFRTRFHHLLIADNGAIQIWDTEELIFNKPGADGAQMTIHEALWRR